MVNAFHPGVCRVNGINGSWMLCKNDQVFLDRLAYMAPWLPDWERHDMTRMEQCKEVSSFLFSSMKTRRTVFPGQPGAKKLMQQYGDKLVCVRYRYDAVRKERIKTVEVVVERGAWEPDTQRIPPNKRIPIQVRLGEKELGKRVREAGGRWNRKKRLWEVPYKVVLDLKLTDRIVHETHG